MTITGHIIGGRIVTDRPLSLPEGTPVIIQAIGAASDSADLSTDDMLRAVQASGTLDFWQDEGEDIYTSTDGDPI